MGKPTSQNNGFINHFSHPHRLQLTPATSSPLCSACKLTGGNGRVYSCRPCNFSLHESCSKMKQVITHPCHPSHTLSLLVAPVYDGGFFNCDGCGINGTGFSYQCSLCDYDIHALCAYKPRSITHKSHPQHTLKLVFQSPYGANKGFSCDICLKIGKNQWLYRCIPCEFDAHVGCITPTNPHLLQHTTSTPNPHTHPAGRPQMHQNSLPTPNQSGNRPRPRPMERPNRPINPNRPIPQNVARRQSNNMVNNPQGGPVGLNELAYQEGQSFGQESMDGSGYEGSEWNEEFDVAVDVDVDVEGEYEGDDVYAEETNDEGEEINNNGLEIVACGDTLSIGCSESEFGGSTDARSQSNDLSDADLYPPSLDNTQGPGPGQGLRPVRMNQCSGDRRKKNPNPNGTNARSKNVVQDGPRGGLQSSRSPIQSPKGPQTIRMPNVRNNAIRGRGGAVSVRVNRPRDPSAFNQPQGLNGPNVGPSNATDGGGNNDNYNEVDGTDVYVDEDNGCYYESYGDDYAEGDGGCDFETGGDFVNDGYDQAYDETYGENDFEGYSDFTGGSESMYDEGESYGATDDAYYSGLNEDPNNQYPPMVGQVGGQGMNNQNQYGQNGRPSNMGMYGRGGAANMNMYGNMNQGANRVQPRAMGRQVQYRPNVRPSMANGGPNGPNGGPNVLANPMLMNTMVQSLCLGFDMNMLTGGASDGGGLGGLFGGDMTGGASDCGGLGDLQF